ncbi:MAG: D-glycerate dehydrogenase [Planctomycetota bacterium]
MTKPVVFIARPLPETAARCIESVATIRQHPGPMPPSREELLRGVDGCAGILSLLSDRIDGEVCEAAGESLRVVANFAVGFNNIDVPELQRRGIQIGNTPDVLTDATADTAVALLLAAARKLPSSIGDVQAGRWKTWEPLGWLGLSLGNPEHPKTLGIVGMGRIGLAVANRLRGGWGMNVVYTSRSEKPEAEAMGATRVSLDELLATSDFVSLHTPLTEATTHLIGHEELSKMKPNAVLVNTSRGEVIDQNALCEALRERQIFAAGLDVCTPEPLPADDPLLALENCIVLPHIGSATVDARDAMAERAASNIVAGVVGEPLPFSVV